MLTVYLDSQDYSVLTDPKQLTPELDDVRQRLIQLSERGDVRFLYSAVTISESTPLNQESVSLAKARADLLVELCGSNALISFDRLIEMERNRLYGRERGPIQVVDQNGDWFPELDLCPSESIWAQMERVITADLSARGVPRQQRRALVRSVIKAGQPRQGYLNYLGQVDVGSIAQEFMKRYPMRPDLANVMARFSIGKATEEQFNEALTESLRDPRWMMRWFASDYSLASPVADLVRKPAKELGDLMRLMIVVARQLAESIAETDGAEQGLSHVAERWNRSVDDQIVAVANRLSRSEIDPSRQKPVGNVTNYCPGLSTMIRSLYSSVWENVNGGKSAPPSNSQAVDAMHAIYAPYVDVFRADRFMSPHIQRFISPYGTVVVSRLKLLPDAIEGMLLRNEPPGISKQDLLS